MWPLYALGVLWHAFSMVFIFETIILINYPKKNRWAFFYSPYSLQPTAFFSPLDVFVIVVSISLPINGYTDLVLMASEIRC